MLTGPGLQWWSRQGLARPKHGAGRTTETGSRASGTAANAARRLHQSCLARSHPSDNWLARNSTKRPQLEQLMQQLKAALRLGVTRAPNSRKLCDRPARAREGGAALGRPWEGCGLGCLGPHIPCRGCAPITDGDRGMQTDDLSGKRDLRAQRNQPRNVFRAMVLSIQNQREMAISDMLRLRERRPVWARPMLSAEKRHQTPSGKAATKEASGAAGLASELSRRGQPRRKRWVNGGGAFSNKADRTTTQSPHGCPHGANAVLCPPPGGSGETKQAHSRPKAQRPEDPSLFQYQMAGCAVQSYRAGCAPLARASCHPSKAPT